MKNHTCDKGPSTSLVAKMHCGQDGPKSIYEASERGTANVGDVVKIQDEFRNRNNWKLGVVQKLNVGRDGTVRSD